MKCFGAELEEKSNETEFSPKRFQRRLGPCSETKAIISEPIFFVKPFFHHLKSAGARPIPSRLGLTGLNNKPWKLTFQIEMVY